MLDCHALMVMVDQCGVLADSGDGVPTGINADRFVQMRADSEAGTSIGEAPRGEAGGSCIR